MLAAVTFEELADLVRGELVRGYRRTERQEGRQRLLAVITELAAGSASADQLLANRTWRIAEMRLAGFGGIAALAPAALPFVPTSGVTVVRGPNGHGKTSLARGIDCGVIETSPTKSPGRSGPPIC